MGRIHECIFGMIYCNKAKWYLVLIIDDLYICAINIIILWVDNLSPQYIIDRDWAPWMVSCDYKLFKVIHIQMIRFSHIYIHHILSKFQLYDLFSRIIILFHTITIVRTILIHSKIMVLICIYQVLDISIYYWDTVHIINYITIRYVNGSCFISIWN